MGDTLPPFTLRLLNGPHDDQSFLWFSGLLHRNDRWCSPGGGPACRDQHAPPHHLRARHDLCHHSSRRDLLRSHVRGIDHIHPHEDSGRSSLCRHLHRRICHGTERPGRPGPCDCRHRLVYRRDGECRGADVSCSPAGKVRPSIWTAGVCQPSRFRTYRPWIHDRRIGHQKPLDDHPGASLWHDRHRSDDRVFPVFVWYCGPG